MRDWMDPGSHWAKQVEYLGFPFPRIVSQSDKVSIAHNSLFFCLQSRGKEKHLPWSFSP